MAIKVILRLTTMENLSYENSSLKVIKSLLPLVQFIKYFPLIYNAVTVQKQNNAVWVVQKKRTKEVK